ncbi:MAG: ATP-binding protein [Bryobacteraceae bacterium]|jgi:signal transduction histidine kinase
MGGLGHRAQLVLFLGAVFVPCAALIAVSARIFNQDRELQAKRRADERHQAVARARSELQAALGAIAADELQTDLEPGQRYRHGETVFVGWAEDGQLVLPWEPERDRAARRCRELISQPDFEPVIRACDQPGGQAREAALASRCYEGVVAAAKHPLQAAYARWLWAQALQNAGRLEAAIPIFRRLLDTGPETTDEDGIPLKLHAAQSLVHAGAARGQLAASVQSVLSARPWLSPVSSFVAADIAESLARTAKGADETRAAEELRRATAAQVRLLQQAESLHNDFPRLRRLLGNRPERPWVLFGDDLWLVGATGDPEGNATVLVIRGQDVFRRVAGRFTDARTPGGEALGDAFPGLKLAPAPARQAPPDPAWNLQRQLVYLALLLVVAATAFAAYLVWRDLQREMRLSELRAQFVSSVSHELKTPLTAIRMFAETLQMGRCADPEAQAEYLGTIVNECERLSRLVDGVLLFSEAGQGKRTYRFRPMQPSDAVRAAVRALEYPLSQHGFRLHMKVQEDLPRIQADRDALEQAILNLLSNAMKFSGDARDIELELRSANGDVVVRVADHGIGIPPEEQSRIFERFYRVPNRENQLIPGTGLGLALVAHIIKAHGGRVEVESAPGKGSTFCLRLPVAPAGRGGQGDVT